MLRINRDSKTLIRLAAPTLAEAAITERYDLQEYIYNAPAIFFREIGQDLFLLGKEVVASNDVQDRIDLLAIDREGACVIVELKRGNHKLHMLQAISYAGMISQWSSEDLLELIDDEQRDALAEFIDVDLDDINRRQRIILLAEAYDYSLLIAAQWLSDNFAVDIVCCRLAIAKDDATNSEYLVCTHIHPPPEIAKQSISRGGKSTAKTNKWSDWESALAGVTNQALVAYLQRELSAGREHYLAKRILRYRIAGKRRWFLAVRRKNAYVWQQGRFPDDVAFWARRLETPDEIKPVKNGECLRLFLYTANDFIAFQQATMHELSQATWTDFSPIDAVVDGEPGQMD